MICVHFGLILVLMAVLLIILISYVWQPCSSKVPSICEDQDYNHDRAREMRGRESRYPSEHQVNGGIREDRDNRRSPGHS